MDMFKFVLKAKLKKVKVSYLKGEIKDADLCAHFNKNFCEALKLVSDYKEKCHTEHSHH